MSKKKRQGVYIKSGTAFPGDYKIGITNNDNRRNGQLSKSMPGDVHTLFFIPMRNAKKVEKNIHWKLRRINRKMNPAWDGHTEWFDPGQTLTWPTVSLIVGIAVFFALPYGKSGTTMAVSCLIGLMSYGIVFVFFIAAFLLYKKIVELLPLIIALAIVVFLIMAC